MNYYKRFPGDYLRDTVHLTMLQDGAYTRLLDWCYANEKPLPAEKPALYRIARSQSASERAAVDVILTSFFTLAAEGWTQVRAEQTIAAHKEVAKVHRDNGRKGGRPETNLDANLVIENETKGFESGKPIPSTTNHQPSKSKSKTQKPPALPAGVSDELWGQWVETRRLLKAPLTSRGAELLVGKLERLIAEGNDPKAVIEQSIERGWKGFFPIDGDRKNGHRPGQFESRIAEQERVASALTGYDPKTRILTPD